MPKQCDEPGCNRRVFGGKKCDWHQKKRTDKKPPKPKKQKVIRFRSKKRAKEEEEYSRERKIFLGLPENQWCAVYPWLPAETVHHKMGRLGKLLLDKRYWVALSLPGHIWVEEHPEEAKKRGLSLNRLS